MQRAFDSRWILGIALLSVLAAVLWSLQRRRLASTEEPRPAVQETAMPEVELLGVPPGAEVTLDGAKIETLRFGVSAGSRHAVEVRGPDGSTWRQVFLARGPIGLLVELQEPLAETTTEEEPGSEAQPTSPKAASEPSSEGGPDSHEAQPRP